MSDYSEQGAVPVEEAAVENPPTVKEMLERRRTAHPEQAQTSTMQAPPSETDEPDEDQATIDAGGEVTGREPDGSLDVEGPNTA